MNIAKLLTGICSFFFFMIGADKFLSFLEPACSLQHNIPSAVWMVLGALQLVAGVLIWMPKFRRPIVGFFFVFMLVFIVVHLMHNTTDIGGAAFMAVLLGLLVWNPSFINVQKKLP